MRKNGSYQRGIAFVTHAHISHESLIKSFNKNKIKAFSHMKIINTMTDDHLEACLLPAATVWIMQLCLIPSSANHQIMVGTMQ